MTALPLALAKILARFPDLADFSCSACRVFTAEIMKLILACHHFSDLTI